MFLWYIFFCLLWLYYFVTYVQYIHVSIHICVYLFVGICLVFFLVNHFLCIYIKRIHIFFSEAIIYIREQNIFKNKLTRVFCIIRCVHFIIMSNLFKLMPIRHLNKLCVCNIIYWYYYLKLLNLLFNSFVIQQPAINLDILLISLNNYFKIQTKI